MFNSSSTIFHQNGIRSRRFGKSNNVLHFYTRKKNLITKLFNLLLASKDEGEVTYGLGHRHIQSFLVFLCLTVGFITSGHIGVTIVAMSVPENNTDTTTNFRLNWPLDENDTQEILRYVDVYQVSKIKL